ncbi:hypothetical protein [Halobacterium bonnevillei]|uniref:Uncharacterized protein n=1 Tax=Halobacterium bonnevillei TaxID=2692200 RepID=A0A6B0SGU1_9EURY|nr:hypothetical protein [Halobacterium bonnevillei]MXR20217.1 hypothetical protein [Halobacterium bonnevillei]
MDERVVLGLLIAAGIVLPGVANYALNAAGAPTVGSIVWAVGYASMVLVVWFGWIRPLDLTGPGGGTEP